MRLVVLIALGCVQRVARWITYRDCICPDRPWLDCEHRPDCPHPLFRRT